VHRPFLDRRGRFIAQSRSWSGVVVMNCAQRTRPSWPREQLRSNSFDIVTTNPGPVDFLRRDRLQILCGRDMDENSVNSVTSHNESRPIWSPRVEPDHQCSNNITTAVRRLFESPDSLASGMRTTPFPPPQSHHKHRNYFPILSRLDKCPRYQSLNRRPSHLLYFPSC